MSIAEYIRRTFNVFSRRHSEEVLDVRDEVGLTTRNRLLLLYRDVIVEQSRGDHLRVWNQFHNSMQYLCGRPVLTVEMEQHGLDDPDALVIDLYGFLRQCSTKEFLDFIEVSFKVEHPPEDVSGGTMAVIDAINEIFRIDGLPYYLTTFVFGEAPREDQGRHLLHR